MKNPVRLLLRVPVPWVFVLGYAVGLALQFICRTLCFPAGQAGSAWA